MSSFFSSTLSCYKLVELHCENFLKEMFGVGNIPLWFSGIALGSHQEEWGSIQDLEKFPWALSEGYMRLDFTLAIKDLSGHLAGIDGNCKYHKSDAIKWQLGLNILSDNCLLIFFIYTMDVLLLA